MTDSQEIEKIKLLLIAMIEKSNEEILDGENDYDVNKVAFYYGAKLAMENTLEMIYRDTIELN